MQSILNYLSSKSDLYQDIAIDTESKTTRFTSVDNCKNLDTLSTENIDRSIKNHEVIFDFKYLSK